MNVKVFPLSLLPLPFTPRRGGSCSILPCGVRTFLSELSKTGAGLARALGSKNSERPPGPEAKGANARRRTTESKAARPGR